MQRAAPRIDLHGWLRPQIHKAAVPGDAQGLLVVVVEAEVDFACHPMDKFGFFDSLGHAPLHFGRVEHVELVLRRAVAGEGDAKGGERQ